MNTYFAFANCPSCTERVTAVGVAPYKPIVTKHKCTECGGRFGVVFSRHGCASAWRLV